MLAKREMVTLGAPIEGIKPHEALMGVLRATAGHVAWLAAEIKNLDGLDGPEASTLVRLYGTERDRLTNVAKACLDSGVSRAEVELTERTTQHIANAIAAAIKSVGGLSDEQRQQFGQALRQELTMTTSGEPA